MLFIALAFSSCKTKEVPGRVRAPRRCNTCTKFSYMPAEATDTLAFPSMSYQPRNEGAYLWVAQDIILQNGLP